MKMSENRNQLFAGVTASLFMLLFCKWLTGEVCHFRDASGRYVSSACVETHWQAEI